MKDNKILSHNIEQIATFQDTIEHIAQKIKERGNLECATVEYQLTLLHELTLFSLGRYLLQNKGIDGYWTDYIVTHPHKGRVTGLNNEGKPFSELERFLLEQAPHVLATQQRFSHFQELLQQEVSVNKKIASLPCGLMRDVLTLNFSKTKGVKLVGIDLDQNSLDAAQQIADQLGLLQTITLIKEDAWSLSFDEEFDVMTSNGLNIYEPDDERVKKLYQKFYNALVPQGVLITSFGTPPHLWDFSNIDQRSLTLEKTIFVDIVGVNWQCMRTQDQTFAQLKEVGFSDIEFIYDSARMFPTIKARKS